MTAREVREFEQGTAYGYRHPGKVHGWSKSVAWNRGLAVGQKRRREEMAGEHKRIMALERRRREIRDFRERDKWPEGPTSETGIGGMCKD